MRVYILCMYRTTLSVAALGAVVLLFAGIGAADGGSSLTGIDLSALQSLIDAIVSFFEGLSGAESTQTA